MGRIAGRGPGRGLLPTLQAGLIETTFLDKPRSRHQRYRLTPVGRELLTQRPLCLIRYIQVLISRSETLCVRTARASG